MNEKLEKYLKKLENEKIKSYQEYLQRQGVYDGIEYSPNNMWSSEYPCCDDQKRFYKKIPIELTAEDIEKIDKYIDIEKKDEDKNKNISADNDNRNFSVNYYEKNYIAVAIKVIAILTYIVGFICGIVFGGADYEFSWGLAFTYWCAFAVSGTITLGFAEVINLLNQITWKS